MKRWLTRLFLDSDWPVVVMTLLTLGAMVYALLHHLGPFAP